MTRAEAQAAAAEAIRRYHESDPLLREYVESIRILHDELGRPFFGDRSKTHRNVVLFAIEKLRDNETEIATLKGRLAARGE